MKAIITVVGRDKVGIIAEVSRVLSENQVNILDISQDHHAGYVHHDYAGGCFTVKGCIFRSFRHSFRFREYPGAFHSDSA